LDGGSVSDGHGAVDGVAIVGDAGDAGVDGSTLIVDAAGDVGVDGVASSVDATSDVGADGPSSDVSLGDAGDALAASCAHVAGASTGNFGTTGAYCFVTCDDITTWACTSLTGRTVSVNGTTVACGAALTKVNDRYVFEVTAGSSADAAINWSGSSHACSP
jgi:hypothetical protein